MIGAGKKRESYWKIPEFEIADSKAAVMALFRLRHRPNVRLPLVRPLPIWKPDSSPILLSTYPMSGERSLTTSLQRLSAGCLNILFFPFLNFHHANTAVSLPYFL